MNYLETLNDYYLILIQQVYIKTQCNFILNNDGINIFLQTFKNILNWTITLETIKPSLIYN